MHISGCNINRHFGNRMLETKLLVFVSDFLPSKSENMASAFYSWWNVSRSKM